MNKKEIIKLLKLLKKDKKTKSKKLKKIKKLTPAPISNIASLTYPAISQTNYQPGFSIPKFTDTNKIESQLFSEYKKARGLLPSENRNSAPSEIELHKEFEKVKKLSKSDIHDLLIDKNVKSQALERQKYLDKLKIDEEKRIQKEQKALLNQELKTKKKIEGIRQPSKQLNQIIQPSSNIGGFSTTDNEGLETAVGGTSDDFIDQLPPAAQKAEQPSLISVGTLKTKRSYNRKSKLN
jgi:hypothetical protein